MDSDESGGVPEWVVTYGDMMSLLLTFFIMLVSLSEVVADKKYRSVLQAIQNYVGYRTVPLTPPGENFPLNSLVDHLQELKLGSFTNEDQGRGGVKTESLSGYDVRVLRTREGSLKLVREPIGFEAGSAQLSSTAERRLRQIVESLAGKPNKIEVRAHTSSAPLPAGSPFANKFTLTYERAWAIRAFLEEHGIDRDRIRLTAAADTEPGLPRADEQPRNAERADIRISDAFVSEYVGPRDVPD